jgi:hypothetical protein
MKKIPTIFIRNPQNMRELTDNPHPDCEWVFAGEGTATRKYDGSCCMIKDGIFYKRREVKKSKTIPKAFIEEQFDKITGKRVGWVPVDETSKEDQYHREALEDQVDGTYELVGPKVQGNPENYSYHNLVSHEKAYVFRVPPPVEMRGLKVWLSSRNIEGVVWHHPDGRMAKIKKRDFGLSR